MHLFGFICGKCLTVNGCEEITDLFLPRMSSVCFNIPITFLNQQICKLKCRIPQTFFFFCDICVTEGEMIYTSFIIFSVNSMNALRILVRCSLFYLQNFFFNSKRLLVHHPITTVIVASVFNFEVM